jgi:hypothetical protein
LAAAADQDNILKVDLVVQQLAAVRQDMTLTQTPKRTTVGAVMASSLFNTKSSSKDIHYEKIRTFF